LVVPGGGLGRFGDCRGKLRSVSTPTKTEAGESSSGSKTKASTASKMGRADKIPVQMLSDRLLVQVDADEMERRSSGGILIPATAQLGKRLTWAEVRAAGPNVRSVQEGDQVLFDQDEVHEVEVGGQTFITLRERDLHAVASERLEEGSTCLYL
jgi:chaperonin GroES